MRSEEVLGIESTVEVEEVVLSQIAFIRVVVEELLLKYIS